MQQARDVPGRLRFGIFEADLRTGELRKRGARVRLQDQPFQVLAALLARPGELVTREELQGRVWAADTFVDFDHGLNKAINKIREALGDSAENPRFVETVARRGYRFIADVAVVEIEPSLPRQTNRTSLPAEPVCASDTTRLARLDGRRRYAGSVVGHPGGLAASVARAIAPRFDPWRCFHWRTSRAMQPRSISQTG